MEVLGMRQTRSPATSFSRRILLLLGGAFGCGWICPGPRGAAAAAAFVAAPPGASPRHRDHPRRRPIGPEQIRCGAGTARYAGSRDDDDNGAGGDHHGSVGWNERLQAFLDQPFYDPDAVLRDLEARNASAVAEEEGSGAPSWRHRFATFVRDDYETAEAVLVGAYMVALVLLTQELVRHLYHHL